MNVTTDSRTEWEKLRRFELHKLAKAWGISCPPGATKDQVVSILVANNINPLDTKGSFRWSAVDGRDENGMAVSNLYPERKPHATAGKDINYTEKMEPKDDTPSLQGQITELKDMLKSFIKASHGNLEKPIKAADETVDEVVIEVPTKEKFSYNQMRQMAKAKGLTIPSTMKAPELEKILQDCG